MSQSNPAACGFHPDASGMQNAAALQCAVDDGGTIVVTRPGTYRIAATVLLGSDTHLIFAHGVRLRKVDEQGPFTQVFLNKGALTRTTDHRITIEGLFLEVNGVDHRVDRIYGLRGQVAFFHANDIRIERFRCMDLGSQQFAIHVCTFEDLIVRDVIIKGKKDGVHLGTGRRFRISDGIFETHDDAIALNAHDYASSNPELGWIEHGVIERCHDLPRDAKPTGFFCRLLAGGWGDWQAGMEVQHSDTVVASGRLYRVQAQPDGTLYRSITPPSHLEGSQILDGINWGMVQNDVSYTCGVRNVVFRDITLESPRPGFSLHFDNDRYSRSYYPGSQIPVQDQILFDNVRVVHEGQASLVNVGTPIGEVTLRHCSLRDMRVTAFCKSPVPHETKGTLNLIGYTSSRPQFLTELREHFADKQVTLNLTE